MPITSVTSDAENLTLTVVGDYPVPVERLWEAYADPRQLEKFWGPEEWPATFTRHDMIVGGRSEYYMTGPDGSRSSGWWRFLAIEPGRRMEMQDGFANEDGTENDAMPSMRMVFSFEPTATGSRFVGVTHFTSLESMEQLVQMGMVEGMQSAMGQLDQVLRDLASLAANISTEAKILSDTQVRITRVIRGSVEQVWQAHHDPALMKRWMLGPPGWSMPVCEVAHNLGDSFRYEWSADDGSGSFGFEGELLETHAPHRAVTTERMIGVPGPGAVNDMTLRAVGAGTLLTLVITYPSAEVRDMVLGTGMIDGMESSYARLETDVLHATAASA